MSLPVVFSITDSAIAVLREKYMPLKVKGLADKSGLAAVHDARIEVKSLRVDVEKKRKELKADALEYGRKVDSEAKRITDLLTPIENHLEAEESIVAQEKERIIQEAERRKRDMIDARLKALADCECMANPATVAEMNDHTFDQLLSAGQIEFRQKQEDRAKAEVLRIATEAKAKEDASKLAAERAELDKLRKDQEAEAARIRAEQAAAQKKIDDERRAIELEKAKAEAAEKARVETEQRIAKQQADAEAKKERERIAAEAAKQKAEAERLRIEAMRPDVEKLLGVAEDVEGIVVPDVSQSNQDTANAIREWLKDMASDIRTRVNGILIMETK